MSDTLTEARAWYASLRANGIEPAGWAPKLLEMVDQMREALVALEWRWSDNANGYCCPTCLSWRDERGPGPDYPPPKRHGSGCTLDAALVGAGLDTQAKRDAARAGMRGGR